eukprot:jgi/Chrzof1/4102/UNPLg00763.t1
MPMHRVQCVRWSFLYPSSMIVISVLGGSSLPFFGMEVMGLCTIRAYTRLGSKLPGIIHFGISLSLTTTVSNLEDQAGELHRHAFLMFDRQTTCKAPGCPGMARPGGGRQPRPNGHTES